MWKYNVHIIVFICLQEQIFDYIFSHLGINTQGCVDHPLLLTEAVCNPNYCRQRKFKITYCSK